MALRQPVDGESYIVQRTDQTTMWEGYEFGRPLINNEWIEDFNYFQATDWTITESDAAATEALATAAPTVGGVLLITNTNADDNAVSMQKVGHSFIPTVGTNIWFECRLQASEATQCDWLVGLVITDTTPLAHADGIVFRKDDGDTQIDFETTNGSASSSETSIGTFAATTYVTVGFKITGTTSVEYFVNGVSQGTLTTRIPTAPLRPTIHFQDGDTAAALAALTMSVDYIMCSQTRA